MYFRKLRDNLLEMHPVDYVDLKKWTKRCDDNNYVKVAIPRHWADAVTSDNAAEVERTLVQMFDRLRSLLETK